MIDNNDDEARAAEAARLFIESCPEGSEVVTFDHANAVGFVIRWSLPGVGFGELTIARSRQPLNDEEAWTVDDESIGPDVLARILAIAFPQGETTRLDLENMGATICADTLLRAFDEVDANGTMAGRYGMEALNTLVDRYTARRPTP